MPGNDSTQKALAHLRSQSGNQDLSLEQAKKGVKLGIPGMAGYLRDDGTIAYVTVMDTVQRYAKPMQKKDEAAIRAYFEREADKSPEEREWEKKQREKGWVQVEPDVWKKKPQEWQRAFAGPESTHEGLWYSEIPDETWNKFIDTVNPDEIYGHIESGWITPSQEQKDALEQKYLWEQHNNKAGTKYRRSLLPKNWTGRDN